MKTSRAVNLLCLAFFACQKPPARGSDDALAGLTLVKEDPPGSPLAGLSDAQKAHFDEGDALFEKIYREDEGLGPLFIRQACAACHDKDGKGPGAVTKMVLVDVDGVTPLADQSLLAWGPTVRLGLAAGAVTPIAPPTSDHLKISSRVGLAVFGRGYMEAVADSEIERVEREQAARGDAISGRINRVTYLSELNPQDTMHRYVKGQPGLIGRFGVKARVATLDDFTADAFAGDMGITSPLRPGELTNPDEVEDRKPGVDVDLYTVNTIADYVRSLRIPPRQSADPRGGALFTAVQCAVCHTPSLRTRPDYAVPQLADVDAPVFSDFLLHDMGDLLADGQTDQSAGPREFKTAPLMGVRHLHNFMHDGRAHSVKEAIAAHQGPGSEANDVVAAFAALSEADQALLIAYVESL